MKISQAVRETAKEMFGNFGLVPRYGKYVAEAIVAVLWIIGPLAGLLYVATFVVWPLALILVSLAFVWEAFALSVTLKVFDD